MSETRQEAYLAYLAGDTDLTLPEPVTQLEKYWHNIAERVSSAVDAPTGTIEMVKNGEYDVLKYAKANVNVPEGNYERLTSAQIDTAGQISYTDFSGSSFLSSYFTATGESNKQGIVEVGDVLKIGLNKDLFGDADDAQVVSGVTYTSKNGLKRKGSHVCTGGGLVLKSGTITNTATIETGLSDVDAFYIHQASSILNQTGLIDLCYSKGTGTKGMYVGSYGQYLGASCGSTTTAPTISGGTVTLNGTGTSAIMTDVEYEWVAVGTA